MKIIQLIFSLTIGGAERLVVNLCNELSINNEVLLITVLKETPNSTFYKPQLSKNVRHINLNCASGFAATAFFKIFKIFQQEKPAVIHSHLNTMLYCVFPALYLNTTFIHTLHSVATKSVGFKQQKILNKWLYKSKRIVPIAISEECATSFKKFYDLNKIEIINNGVPNAQKTQQFNAAKSELQQLPEINFKIKFIHVSRFAAVKNQNVLISVFNTLINEGAPIALLVVGEGFENIKKEIQLEKGIHLLGARENPTDFIMQSDCLVLTSLWEGMPMCALEALSCGIPIVSTPAGGMIDIIKSDVNGLLSEKFDQNSIKQTVIKMIAKLQSNGYNKSEILSMHHNNYSIAKCSAAYLEVYEGA